MFLTPLAVKNRPMTTTSPSCTTLDAHPWPFLHYSKTYNNLQLTCKLSSNHCLHQLVTSHTATTTRNPMDNQSLHHCQMTWQQQIDCSFNTVHLLPLVTTSSVCTCPHAISQLAFCNALDAINPIPQPDTHLLTRHTVQLTIACRCGNNKHQSTTPAHSKLPCIRIASAAPCPSINTVLLNHLMLTHVLLVQLDHPPDPTQCPNYTPSQFTFSTRFPICNVTPPMKV